MLISKIYPESKDLTSCASLVLEDLPETKAKACMVHTVLSAENHREQEVAIAVL